MAGKNKKVLIVGLIFIIISFICIGGVLYFMGEKQHLEIRKVTALEVELANLIAEKSEAVIKASDPNWYRREAIELEDIAIRAEKIYGEKELNRKEGVLWIDRKTSLYLVTLGIINGVQKGSLIGIYEGNMKIGSVEVKDFYDIISYVDLVDKTSDDFDKDYYKVIIED